VKRKQVSAETEKRVRETAKNRCGYCLMSQNIFPLKLEIEHIRPLSKGGTNSEENLWLSCRACNSFKGSQTRGYDKLTNRRVIVQSAPSKMVTPFQLEQRRDTDRRFNNLRAGDIEALNLNNVFAVRVRIGWVSVGWHPPND